MLISAAVGLLAVVGVFILGDQRVKAGVQELAAGASAAVAAQAPAAAPSGDTPASPAPAQAAPAAVPEPRAASPAPSKSATAPRPSTHAAAPAPARTTLRRIRSIRKPGCFNGRAAMVHIMQKMDRITDSSPYLFKQMRYEIQVL